MRRDNYTIEDVLNVRGVAELINGDTGVERMLLDNLTMTNGKKVVAINKTRKEVLKKDRTYHALKETLKMYIEAVNYSQPVQPMFIGIISNACVDLFRNEITQNVSMEIMESYSKRKKEFIGREEEFFKHLHQEIINNSDNLYKYYNSICPVAL